MKKSILFGAFCAAVLTTATFVACNSTDEPIADSAINPVTVPTSGFDGFMASVDSLNNVYLLQSRSNAVVSADGGDFTQVTDERMTKNKVVSYADQAGAVVGCVAGWGVGAAIGTPAGNIGAAIMGGLCGDLGRIVYSHLYSAVAKLALGYMVVNPKFNSAFMSQPHTSEYAYLDSIGVRHNRLMQNMTKYDKKYMNMNLNNRVLLNQFYADFIRELNAVYPEVGGFKISLEEKERILESCTSVIAIGKKCVDNNESKSVFVNEVSNIMIKKYGVPQEKVRVFKDFAVSVSDQMEKIDGEVVNAYAKDLSKAIQKSALDESEKADVVGMAQISVNSNICWKE